MGGGPTRHRRALRKNWYLSLTEPCQLANTEGMKCKKNPKTRLIERPGAKTVTQHVGHESTYT